ncbi:MAG: hypothetical protein E7404_01520 [Ruminococcaceae bacterium]|nr:hypothetical protein [Oscillospiraceae bacterium]
MVNWGNAILVAVLGLATVFAVLIIIMVAIMIMAKIFAPAKKETPKKEEILNKPVKNTVSVPKKDIIVEVREDTELIAVFAAAIAASLNTSTYNLKIKSYRRLGEAKSSWQNISRKENIYTKL